MMDFMVTNVCYQSGSEEPRHQLPVVETEHGSTSAQCTAPTQRWQPTRSLFSAHDKDIQGQGDLLMYTAKEPSIITYVGLNASSMKFMQDIPSTSHPVEIQWTA